MISRSCNSPRSNIRPPRSNSSIHELKEGLIFKAQQTSPPFPTSTFSTRHIREKGGRISICIYYGSQVGGGGGSGGFNVLYLIRYCSNDVAGRDGVEGGVSALISSANWCHKRRSGEKLKTPNAYETGPPKTCKFSRVLRNTSPKTYLSINTVRLPQVIFMPD